MHTPATMASDKEEKIPLPELNNTHNDGESGGDGSINLKPKITLLNGVTVIVGSIIGSGIFVSPKGVLAQTGSVGLSLIVWFVCGLFSLVGSYCFAELGTAIVRSGADYAYIYEAFGPFLAFLRLWVEAIVVRPCTTAVVALTFAYYIIEPVFPGCDQPDLAVQFLAALCICKYLFFLFLDWKALCSRFTGVNCRFGVRCAIFSSHVPSLNRTFQVKRSWLGPIICHG